MTAAPKPKDFTHHLSETAKRRHPNVYKLFYQFYDIPGLQDISGGLPHPSLFPIEDLSGHVVKPKQPFTSVQTKDDVSLVTDEEDINVGLQYGQVTGFPAFDKWIQDFVSKYLPKCRYDGGYSVLQTTGSTDGWVKALQILSNEYHDWEPIERKQGLLVEQFTYSSAAEAARVRGLNIVSIPIDKQGIIPEEMEQVLKNWDESNGARPHMLYTISIGQNPTGSTVPPERRQKIYDICSKYDIIICEDEPYWFMQYVDPSEEVECYLKYDTDGRVLRFDSFSKTLAPGCRLGWVVGQPALVQRIFYLAEEATQQPSGFSQLLVYKMLKEWGQDGWMDWVRNLRDEYQERRDLMISALSDHCEVDGERVLEFEPPKAGMFVWTKVRFDLHPLASKLPLETLSKALWIASTKHNSPALVNPGIMFAPDRNDLDKTLSFFRLSFAPSTKPEIGPASRSFGEAVQNFWSIDPATAVKYCSEFPDL